MKGTYALELVFASYCVAVIAAFTAIYFGARVRSLSGSTKTFWFAIGAFCLGTGIWSMHFVGMSAYKMPMEMEMSFDFKLTATSLIIAVLASGLGLKAITSEALSLPQLIIHAFIMGTGVFTMHYTGMFAMKMDPAMQYDNFLVFISGVIAVVACGAALWICRNIDKAGERYSFWVKLVAALVMGVAICGMHYTGMAAVSFPIESQMAASNTLRGNWMGTPTAIASSIFILLLVYIAFQDFRELERIKKEKMATEQTALHAAFNDKITNLPNRTAFEDQLLKVIGKSDSFTLLYLELNSYRDMSKHYGEAQAQELARTFSERLRGSFGEAIYIARNSTTGFFVLLNSANKSEATQQAKQFVDKNDQPLNINGESYWPTFSVGFSSYPSSGTNTRLLIRQAQVVKTKFSTQPVTRMVKDEAVVA
ncbi:diguanylate cyclase [Aestuariicella hydrocarbonica]|uniref:Diguanylate cyclase n=1 Tax=Pseudomaricurvus hydrocarbonicus TaxID=1470433 RepID=A0A9E5MMW1_9GAMM|nr:MHYT domain-containing protein [Aestuariicella hydrocarbonica]NHO67179.1 diguanylate cyclase [Aestuariicella hydrocarbonica]